jgi:hypothetical protein
MNRELIHRFRYYQLHRCVWCQRIIWPWQNWIFARVGERQGHYHNAKRQKCFQAAMTEAGLGKLL